MKIEFKNPVIFVENIEFSKRFYIETIGEVIKYDFGKNVTFASGLSLWELSDDLQVSRSLGSAANGGMQYNRLELYYETDDLEASFERINKAGMDILHHIHEEPWGQSAFRFYDPDRHLVEIAETMEAFVTRFRDDGMNAGEIAERTGINVAVIESILDK